MNRLFFTLIATTYRLIQRMMVLDISKLLVCDISGKRNSDGAHPNATFRFISAAEVLKGAEDPDLDLQAEMANRLNAGLDKCAGAFVDGQLIGYLWIAFQGIEAEHNSGKHPSSGIAVSFDTDSVFLYKGYAKRAHRKQGLSCLLSWLANELAESDGITQLISTTEWLNVPGYRALRGGGFQLVGHTWRAILFGMPIDWGPRKAADHGIRLGKDAVVPQRTISTERLSDAEPDKESAFESREPVGV